jgi:hypothetical protein
VPVTQRITLRRRNPQAVPQQPTVPRGFQTTAMDGWTTNPCVTYEQRMGTTVPIEIVGQASGRGTWAAIEWRAAQLDAMASFVPPRRLMATQNIFPNDLLDASGVMSDAQWAEAVSGAYDIHFVRAAQRLVAWGFADAIVRVGHEFNGNWYSWWARPGHEADYAAYFRRIVDAMRSVPGARFEFVWNAAKGAANMNAELAYPGDAWVDHIGVDFYDTNATYYGKINNNPRWWQEVDATTAETKRRNSWERLYFTSQRGMLLWWVDFCTNPSAWSAYGRQVVKPLCFPEMGTSIREDNGNGGGDNPIWYCRRMVEFFLNPFTNVSFWSWFEVDAPDGLHRLYHNLATEMPLSRDEWSAQWAGGPRTKG